MKELEMEWEDASCERRLDIALKGTFYVVGYCLALHGEEVPLMEIKGLCSHWDLGVQDPLIPSHVVVTLLGRFNSEIGECHHLISTLAITLRGLEPRKWVRRMLL